MLATEQLTTRWTPLDYHPEQARWMEEDPRFAVVPAGRRSGKTEISKRKKIIRAIEHDEYPDYWAVFTAPTQTQAKRIFWKDLKLMVPASCQRRKPSESDLTVYLVNGAEITVLGMDVPERIEGRPLDDITLDEYGNMKKKVWDEHVRPALSTRGRPGRADFIGVPEGRNHYFRLGNKAQADKSGEWGYYHWISADILDPAEVESARRDLDPLTFAQEYEGSFINFEGRAYYGFQRTDHCRSLQYDPKKDLIFCFDFNVSPGVAVVCQEFDNDEYIERAQHPRKRMRMPDGRTVTIGGALPPRAFLGAKFTGVIGEVWIPKNSNTIMVAKKLIQDWSHHKGRIICYGDATGGSKGSAKVQGSDWDLIRETFKRKFNATPLYSVSKANPTERQRVNAMNSRLRTSNGMVRFLVDPHHAPHVVEDLEGVPLVEGGSGEIDKKADKNLTHVTDALGYYIEKKHPIRSAVSFVEQEIIF